MAEPGWYPDPEGVPGRLRYWDGGRWTADTLDERHRRNRLIVLLTACLALAVVITIIVVIMVRTDDGAVRDTRPPAAPTSGWNDSSPTGSASATPTPRRSGSPSASPSASPPPPTKKRPLTRCPAGEPQQTVKHSSDDRVHGGQLSYRPVSGHGFGRPQVDDHYGWWYDEHAQTATVRSGDAAGRSARIAVGSIAIQDGFRSIEQAAHSSLQCLISTDDYAAYTGQHLLHSKEIAVDGQRSWQLTVEVDVRGRHRTETGDRVRLIVVDAGAPGSYSIFVGVSPLGDSATRAIIDKAAAGLKVGG